jgi:hypothetical protein
VGADDVSKDGADGSQGDSITTISKISNIVNINGAWESVSSAVAILTRQNRVMLIKEAHSKKKHIPVGSQGGGGVVMLGKSGDVLVLDLDNSGVVQGMGENDGRYSHKSKGNEQQPPVRKLCPAFVLSIVTSLWLVVSSYW